MNQTTSVPEASSLANRAMMAVALLIGFYLLAFGIAGVLLYIPYAGIMYAGRINIQLSIFCVIGAVVILWSLIPRREKFVAPGPLLTEKDHPRLFKEIRDIADATRQEMPSEVYLVAEPNAWVMDRKNFLGLGTTRVMGIGLALMQLLDTDQLRAVLAHEFGHFHSGDTKLGPWVYKTRALIGRTLHGLSGHSSLLQRPFIWYGNAFLRITHSVSRQQEYTADALAATIVGPAPLIGGLKLVSSGAPAFDGYWQSEMRYILGSGYLPPIMEGFCMYMSAPSVSNILSRYAEEELARAKTNPYDTHPSLPERIAALQRYPEKKRSENPTAPSISLLNNIDELEKQLLITLAGSEPVGKLVPITWAEAAEKVWIPQWKENVGKAREAMAGITPEMLPDIVNDRRRFASILKDGNGNWIPQEHQVPYLASLFGSAVALALLEEGWNVHAVPGEDVALKKGDRIIASFFTMIQKFAGEPGEETSKAAEEWRALCRELNISVIDLGK